MGLFEKFFTYFQRKKKERDSLCRIAMAEISSANQAIQNLVRNTPGYIYAYNYVTSLAEWRKLEDRLPSLNRQMRKATGAHELQQLIQRFQSALAGLDHAITYHNKTYLKEAIADAYIRIGNVEGRPLDTQQMACIVKDAPNHLVIAGAGTGKTTTILGKVKYLLATDVCKANEILVLSFTKGTASEMKERLRRETNRDIPVFTFHGLGHDIIHEVEGKKPNVYKDNLSKFIVAQIERCLEKTEYARLFMTYLLFHRVNQKSEFDFDSVSSYKEYLTVNPPTTIKGEMVKSYGEMEIANFLMEHSIEYEYEAAYKVDTRTEEFGQYYPDFYLPQYGIYIEYYGINKKGEVPAYFTGRDGKTATEVYREGIAWKKNIHRTHGTTLIECYAYEKFDGILLENLQKNLQKNAIPLKQVAIEQLFIHMDAEKLNIINGLAELFQTILSLLKNNRLTTQNLIDMCTTPALMGQRILAQLFAPVYDSYEQMLTDRDLIDYNDMLNNATDYVTAGTYHHSFKYIIIDEYQDISKGQYDLLKAMRKDSFFALFCVGDDWQSIYQFAGSDIGYILKFSKYWGAAETSKIETTYRFSQRLIDISSRFAMANPNQLKKSIRAANDIEPYVLGEIKGDTSKWAVQLMISRLEDLPRESTVYFIGRYKFDVDILQKSGQLQVFFDNRNQAPEVRLPSRPDLKMAFYTAHKSKGLQADFVFIINNRATHMGFPSKVQNPPLVNLLLEQADFYPDAEERRLFYVAMTRARRRVYLVTTEKNLSSFAKELKSQYQEEMNREICPLCGAPLKIRSGQYGPFLGCSNYRNTGCRHTRKM